MTLRKAQIGLAAAVFLAFAAVNAQAGNAVCQPHLGFVDHSGTDGSECYASTDGTGKAHATASGDHSYAEADQGSHSKSTATATGGSQSYAESDTGGHSTSHASDPGSFAKADTDEHGKAKATATGGGNGQAQAFGKCKSSGKATGANSMANGHCENGGFADATATNGGIAMAYDDGPPTCDTSSGGTAKVRSTFGNCP
ncbi:MAG: hypothetical protein ACREQH_09660 [Candidatus Binatus sp.]